MSRTTKSQQPVEGSEAGASGGGVITAVLTLHFVAAPGRPPPDPRTIEYRLDMSRGHGSQEVSVFLGEVKYGRGGGRAGLNNGALGIAAAPGGS